MAGQNCVTLEGLNARTKIGLIRPTRQLRGLNLICFAPLGEADESKFGPTAQFWCAAVGRLRVGRSHRLPNNNEYIRDGGLPCRLTNALPANRRRRSSHHLQAHCRATSQASSRRLKVIASFHKPRVTAFRCRVLTAKISKGWGRSVCGLCSSCGSDERYCRRHWGLLKKHQATVKLGNFLLILFKRRSTSKNLSNRPKLFNY